MFKLPPTIAWYVLRNLSFSPEKVNVCNLIPINLVVLNMISCFMLLFTLYISQLSHKSCWAGLSCRVMLYNQFGYPTIGQQPMLLAALDDHGNSEPLSGAVRHHNQKIWRKIHVFYNWHSTSFLKKHIWKSVGHIILVYRPKWAKFEVSTNNWSLGIIMA